jgi:hypothetical protein
MNNIVKLTTFFGISSSLLFTSALSFAQADKPSLPKTPPNELLIVTAKTGNCPKSLGMWLSFRSYEGGGEHTVIPNTFPMAGVAKLTSKGKKFVEYTAPLKSNYVNCVGTANIEKEGIYKGYKGKFEKGNLIFRLEIPNDTPSSPTDFSKIAILANRPFVRWAIAD